MIGGPIAALCVQILVDRGDAKRREHHVVRLQVAMNDALLMGMMQSIGNFESIVS